MSPISLVAGLILITLADELRGRITLGIFTLTAVTLFTCSALYHRVAWNDKNKAIWRRIDHSNIAILIAYLKLIRTKKHINILFLDEVFSSIDLEGIDSILMLLKSFANDYNINIFVVHHAILSEEMFDRILKINNLKKLFSLLLICSISVSVFSQDLK